MTRNHRIWPLAIAVLAVLAGPLAAAPPSPATSTPVRASTSTPTPVLPAVRGLSAAALLAFFPWYDNASAGMSVDNVHITNPGTALASGSLTLPGVAPVPFTVGAGSEGYYSFPAGTRGGPLTVTVSSGPPVLSSQRTLFNNSLSEIGSLPSTGGFMTGYFSWFDNQSVGMTADYLHLVNPGSAVSAGTIQLGSTTLAFSVPAGGEQHLTFPPGTSGGPVKVQVTSGSGILATQRTIYLGSLNEVPAMAATAAAGSLYFNWYDNQSPGMDADFVHVINPGAAAVTATVAVAGASASLNIPAGGEAHASFPGVMGGPVSVTSSAPVLASQRILYHHAFQEQTAFAAGDASPNWEFSWYDNGSPGFIAHVHLINPGASASNAYLILPARNPVLLAVAAGQDVWYAFPAGTVAGPLQVQVVGGGPALLVGLRQFVYIPPPPPPATVPTSPPVSAGHRIVISISQQHLWAYDGDSLFLDTDVTTGRAELPTPTGTYHVFTHQTPFLFISPWPAGSPYWYASAWVSYAMEFIDGGYYLHDAPWRTWYGPGSNTGDGTHGCVNIPLDAMTRLFYWTQLGDEVTVNP